jgi:RNA polymerase sigma factor (sigma-70 family)
MSPRIPIGLLAAQSDRRLLELVREGHERAFEVLVKRYRRQLLRYCRRMGLSDSRSEDVLQQAFLQAWLALERGVDVRAPKPWLYRIVHNAAVNVLRRSPDEHTELVDGAAVDSVAEREPGIESGLAVRQTLSDVAALPPMQREAMLMSAVDGRSHEEVADALGITHGAVRGLLYRARSTLRDAAAALIPQPLVSWAAGCASRGAPTADRLAELSAQGGGAGVLVRGAEVAVSAAVLAAGVAVVPRHAHGASRASGRSHADVAAPVVGGIARSPTVPGSQAAAVPAHRTAALAPSTGGGTRLATGSAPIAVTSPRRSSSTPVRSAPAPAISAPTQRGSSGQHSSTPSQASSLGVAASAPTSTPSPAKTEPAPPPPSGSVGEKVKEEPPPPSGSGGGEPRSDDGSEESHEGHKPGTEEPKTPPKTGEKPDE